MDTVQVRSDIIIDSYAQMRFLKWTVFKLEVTMAKLPIALLIQQDSEVAEKQKKIDEQAEEIRNLRWVPTFSAILKDSLIALMHHVPRIFAFAYILFLNLTVVSLVLIGMAGRFYL